MTRARSVDALPTADAEGRRSDPTDLDIARAVLRHLAAGLDDLAGALDDRFVAAMDEFAQVTGRVVVSGMGKSGHVARKIAATMASTGTPAFYLHPGEASHGDLGMIDKDKDLVLVLSNSGETPELADLLAYCKRFGIPLIAVVGRGKSTVGDAATTALVIPAMPEAGPLGLAPTTSTTAMMALGDCLALALMQRHGFTAGNFRDLHPGGRLGSSLLRVADIMHEGEAVPTVGGATKMGDAILTMTAKAFGCVGIIDGERLVGIITDGDLRRHMQPGLLERQVADIMTPSPKTIRPQALAAEALGTMNENTITSLFVCEDERPVGIVHIHDCLRAGVA